MRLRSIGVLLLGLILASFSPAPRRNVSAVWQASLWIAAAPVPGATVTVTNKTTGTVRTVVTGADGTYRLPDLDPGRYTVVSS